MQVTSKDSRDPSQMSKSAHDIGPEEVPPRVTASHNKPGPMSPYFCLGGIVEAVGSRASVFDIGDGVLTLYYGRSDDGDPRIPETLWIAARNVLPDAVCNSSRDSMALMHAVWTAAAILHEELDLPILTPSRNRLHEDPLFRRRVLFVGGETSVGAAMVRLLHTAAPDIKVVGTSMIADQERLLTRTIALVELGATFAIDGAAPDLMDELRRPMQDYVGVDVIVDVNCLGHGRDALLGLLVGERRLIDCAGIDAETTMRSMLDDGDLVTHIGKAAKAISKRVSFD